MNALEYRLKIDEEIVPVTVDTDGESGLTAIMGQEQQTISYTVVSDHQIYLMVNGRGHNVYLNDEPDGKTVMINGQAYLVQDADDLERKPARKKGAHNAPTEVTPLTPSVVVSVLVKEGDLVEMDQKVVVLSAMKMEVTLTAPFAGKVIGIKAAEGDKVAPGQILVDIEKETDAT